MRTAYELIPRCVTSLEVEQSINRLERELGDGAYLVGDDFTGADVMMGFTLVAARVLGVLDERYSKTNRYMALLEARPAFQKAVAIV